MRRAPTSAGSGSGVDPDSAKDGSMQLFRPARLAGGASRVWLIVAVLAGVVIAAWSLQRIVDVQELSWFQGTDSIEVGKDFQVFYVGSVLVADGDIELLYDFDAFQAQFEEHIGRAATPNMVFANPPAFALVVAPLTTMAWQTAWIVWTVLSLAALVVAVRVLSAQRALLVAGTVALTLPGLIAITSGQSTFFWLLIVAGVFALLRRGSRVAAGALAGLLILKPPLLIGFGLWWLMDRRMHRTLLAAVSSAAAIVIASTPFVGRAWLEYPFSLIRFADLHQTSDAQVWQFSPWGFFDPLVPGYPGVARLAGILAAILGAIAFLAFYRRHRDEWPLLFAASIITTLWISPHVLVYDWVLLVAALAILWRARPESAKAWRAAAVALVFAASSSLLVANLMRDTLGWVIQFAVPTLALVAWYIAHQLRSAEPVSDEEPPAVDVGRHPAIR